MKFKVKKLMPMLAMGIVAIMHVVGFFGLQSSYAEEFANLTAINLLIAFLLILPFAQQDKSPVLLFFVFTFTIGMSVEILGVQTAFPFGSYFYTPLLSWSIVGVPLLIGINWFILAYGILSLENKVFNKGSIFLKSVLGATFMTLMDLLIEPFAIEHQLWVWESHVVPVQNYVAWFVISLFIFLFGFKILPKEENRLAAFTVFIFLIFFSLNLLVV